MEKFIPIHPSSYIVLSESLVEADDSWQKSMISYTTYRCLPLDLGIGR